MKITVQSPIVSDSRLPAEWCSASKWWTSSLPSGLRPTFGPHPDLSQGEGADTLHTITGKLNTASPSHTHAHIRARM
ncbi:MAG: hypothetical protein IJB28_03940 [Bacteroidaceae bacterium]|nr:hypothetical protein [Bacteroidaceae bacterium]